MTMTPATRSPFPGIFYFARLLFLAIGGIGFAGCAPLPQNAVKSVAPALQALYVSFAAILVLMGVVLFIVIRLSQRNASFRAQVAERKQAQAHLQMLERRYRTLVENSPFPMIVASLRRGAILYLNPQAAHKFEVVRKFAIGRPARDLFVDPEHWNDLLKKFERQTCAQGIEMRLKGAAGATFWASVSASVVMFEGEPAVFLALVDISERKRLEVQLQEMAMTDALTGLFNRRYFTQKGEEEFVRAQRYHTPFSMLMLDVDKFKLVNDTLGHDAGDQVLRQLALALRQSARNVDTLSRLGGEEFGMILPNTSRESALVMAERMRREVEQTDIALGHVNIKITVSIGVATFHFKMSKLDDLLRDADTALYQAKQNGRNQVVVH